MMNHKQIYVYIYNSIYVNGETKKVQRKSTRGLTLGSGVKMSIGYFLSRQCKKNII